MAVPQMGRALRGWVKKIAVKIVTQVTVNHKNTETTTDATLEINKQPMPAAQVNRKPEEQRTWKWWSIIIRNRTTLLKTDDKIIFPNDGTYRIQSANDWRESGFSKYEAIEDYEEST